VGNLKLFALSAPVIIVATLVVVLAPSTIAVVLGGVLLLFISLRWSAVTSPLLVVLAIPFMRPSILGEDLSVIATLLVALAAFLAIVHDRGHLKLFSKNLAPLRRITFWIGLAYVWLLVRAALFEPQANIGNIIQSAALMLGTLVLASIVLADANRAKLVGRLFIILIAALSVSYLVTLAVWAVGGVGSGQVALIPVGSWPGVHPVYFPFSSTLSQSNIGGLVIPRFVGIGREPGWMALYGAVAFFLAPAVGWRSKPLRAALLVSVVAPLSTAGFGSFAVAAVVAWVVATRAKSLLGRHIKFLFSGALLAVSVWLAIAAPVLGLSAKATLNELSLDERTRATIEGLNALLSSPFSGGMESGNIGAVNLIASIGAYGLPFAVAIALAILSPLTGRWKVLAPTATVIFITLLVSQPALDSTAVFLLVAIAVSQHGTTEEDGAPDSTPQFLSAKSMGGRGAAAAVSAAATRIRLDLAKNRPVELDRASMPGVHKSLD